MRALPALRLSVTFVDGLTGEADLSGFLNGDQVTGTIFESLRQQEFFSEVSVLLGAVQWPNGADLAPDAMYEAIRQRGYWIVE